MILKFKKLDNKAVSPKSAKSGDAGADLTAISYSIVEEQGILYHNYEFGLAIEIPSGYVGLLFPRSSSSKTDLVLANGVGVIDSGYRGSLSARFKQVKDDPKVFSVGDRVCQLVVVPYALCDFHEVGELSISERGSGGWGSSGR